MKEKAGKDMTKVEVETTALQNEKMRGRKKVGVRDFKNE